MKVLLSVVSHEEVVDELIIAMKDSTDRFSQDRSFDFQLVRIDRFQVPPQYAERYDDACTVYDDWTNEHPNGDEMRSTLLRTPENSSDTNHLHYASVLFRSGDFGQKPCWGARFYIRIRRFINGPLQFIQIDCREGIEGRGTGREIVPTSSDVRNHFMFSPMRVDAYTLHWVLTYATKKVTFGGTGMDRALDQPVLGIRRFRDGLGKIEELVQGSSSRILPFRYGWACASLSDDVKPPPYEGAGEHIAKLFEPLERCIRQ